MKSLYKKACEYRSQTQGSISGFFCDFTTSLFCLLLPRVLQSNENTRNVKKNFIKLQEKISSSVENSSKTFRTSLLI